ncbi:gonadotropin-releasing hormone II receptor-like [Monodelphis domestica]|uniref:gonadotropin-releasing hormone II receptor-like n=1 Tax=Monodelphis domestica TaxID=13616 RepID=UPI00044324E4|nr:gonadotropin-releasing hormone II receptor-like [Monodelphis domestica]
MTTSNDTVWGSSVGEEAWAGAGVQVEESALPTFSTAAKIRVGVTAALFLSSAVGNLAVLWSVTRPRSSRLRPSPVRRLFGHLAAADLLVTFVVMPLDAAWNTTVQWLAGDVACRTLMFLKLLAMYAAAFLPVVIGLDRQAAVLHPLGPRGGGRKLLGTAWGLSFLLALPQFPGA